MNIMEQETQVLDNTTGRALFKIQTVGKVIYISNCKIDNFPVNLICNLNLNG